MKKIVMSAFAALFLVGTSFAGTGVHKTTKAPVKQEAKKSDNKKAKKVSASHKKVNGEGKNAKPKEDVKK